MDFVLLELFLTEQEEATPAHTGFKENRVQKKNLTKQLKNLFVKNNYEPANIIYFKPSSPWLPSDNG